MAPIQAGTDRIDAKRHRKNAHADHWQRTMQSEFLSRPCRKQRAADHSDCAAQDQRVGCFNRLVIAPRGAVKLDSGRKQKVAERDHENGRHGNGNQPDCARQRLSAVAREQREIIRGMQGDRDDQCISDSPEAAITAQTCSHQQGAHRQSIDTMTGNGCDRSRRCGDRPIALGNDEAKVLERRKTKRHGERDDENILHAPDVDLLLREAQEDEKLDRLFRNRGERGVHHGRQRGTRPVERNEIAKPELARYRREGANGTEDECVPGRFRSKAATCFADAIGKNDERRHDRRRENDGLDHPWRALCRTRTPAMTKTRKKP